MKKKFVVVGASAASLAFITKLRSVDKESDVTCVSGESEIPYNRCFLADYLSEDIAFEGMLLKPKEFFEQNNITLKLNSWVTGINTDKNYVLLGSEQVSYDYLFLGIGSKPFIPNIGIDLSMKNVSTFHTAADIKKIVTSIEQEKPMNVVVIGAGLNGVECASALHSKNITVSLVDQAESLLPLQVDDQASEYVASILQHRSVGMLLGNSVVSLCSQDGRVQAVKLDSGATIPTDFVVLATGSVPYQELLQQTSIKTQEGSIVVDASMKTSVDNVYAGGDICIVQDAVTKELVKSSTWSDAMLQGLCAATQFSSAPRQYPGAIGLRDSKFFDYSFYACGKTVGYDESYKVVTHIGMDSLTKLYTKDNKLKGFLLIGDITKVADYKRLYLMQQELSEQDLK